MEADLIGAVAEVSILDPVTPSHHTSASVNRVPVSREVPPASVQRRKESIVLPVSPKAEK